MSETRYVVDDYLNSIKRVSAGRVRPTAIHFPTELQATEYILIRAERKLVAAEKQLSRASNQVKKWKNLYAIRARGK